MALQRICATSGLWALGSGAVSGETAGTRGRFTVQVGKGKEGAAGAVGVPGLGALGEAGALGGFPGECQLPWEVKVDGAQAKKWGSVPDVLEER